jgi:DNA-binding protein HU-beta
LESLNNKKDTEIFSSTPNRNEKPLNKKELIDEISDKAGLNKATSAKALNGTLDAIADSLKRGFAVTLIGFRSFSISTRKAKQGRNPQTGTVMNIPEKKVAKFKAGKALEQNVN